VLLVREGAAGGYPVITRSDLGGNAAPGEFLSPGPCTGSLCTQKPAIFRQHLNAFKCGASIAWR
jgi:hypothetical protein